MSSPHDPDATPEETPVRPVPGRRRAAVPVDHVPADDSPAEPPTDSLSDLDPDAGPDVESAEGAEPQRRSRRPRSRVARDRAGSGARRDRTRRLDTVLLLSLVVPLATVGALATVHPGDTVEPDRAPGEAPLTRTLLVCPAGLPGSEDVTVAFADPAGEGSVSVVGADPFAVAPGTAVVRRSAGTVVLEGTDSTAVGLVAVRGDAALGTACQGPRSDVWFTGVGAGPEHMSRLRLVNPDSGPAVADVEVLGADGTQEVRALRGLTVAPHQESVIDLESVIPDREDLSLRVTVPRGRLALSVTDTFQEIGSEVKARSWLGGQQAGGTTVHLLGVEKGAGERTLVVANAGADEARVRMKLITADSEFTPASAKLVTVAPGSTTTVDLSSVLTGDDAKDVLGVRLDSEVPVTATLRTVRGKRVQHTVGASWIREQAATVVPGGGGALVIAGAATMTDVVLRQRTADGTQLAERVVPVPPGTAVRVALAASARTFSLEVGDVPVRAAVIAKQGDPAQVRVLEELSTRTAVPHVSPALK